jgi:hypothetical protein
MGEVEVDAHAHCPLRVRRSSPSWPRVSSIARASVSNSSVLRFQGSIRAWWFSPPCQSWKGGAQTKRNDSISQGVRAWPGSATRDRISASGRSGLRFRPEKVRFCCGGVAMASSLRFRLTHWRHWPNAPSARGSDSRGEIAPELRWVLRWLSRGLCQPRVRTAKMAGSRPGRKTPGQSGGGSSVAMESGGF